MQEAACRALLPGGAAIRVISDSGGHNSGHTADRDGYQALLAAVAAGQVTGIAVYDLSRLFRNARLMLDLAHELERRQVPLLVANLPGARFDGATGRYMFGQLCLANQLQRDLDSERMTRMQRQLFEDGRHRGHDPLGYRSRHDATGHLVHPRELVLVPEEADAVRRVWQELERFSLLQVADLMNREGIPHRGPWNRETVKDIARRGRMYLGYVVEKRGRDERPGRHEPILSEAQYRRTLAAIAARTRVGNKPSPFRSYALRGLVYCACGTRMRGEAHLQRGTEIRYYRCPTLGCHARRCPAELVEEKVMSTIATAVLPDPVIEEARAELRHRLDTPGSATAGRQRARLTIRLEQHKKQHGWGDISDRAYQAERDSIRAALAQLPDEDRIRTFDAYRAKLSGLACGDRRSLTCAARGTLSNRRRTCGRERPGRGRHPLDAAERGTPKRIRTADLNLERVVS